MLDILKMIGTLLKSQAFGVLGGMASAYDIDQKNKEIRNDNEKLQAEVLRRIEDTGKAGRRDLNLGHAEAQRLMDQFRSEGLGQINEFNKYNKGKWDDIVGQYDDRFSDLYGGLSSAYDASDAEMAGLVGDFGGRASDVMGAYDQGAQTLGQNYGNRTNQIMAQFEGLGDQARRELGERYDVEKATGMQDLQSRGLSGTTGGASLQQGLARSRERDQGNLEERLRRERIGYETQLTGDDLANQAAQLVNRTSLNYDTSGDTLSAQLQRAMMGNADAGNLANFGAGLSGEGLAAAERGQASNQAGQQDYMSALGGYQASDLQETLNHFGNMYQNNQTSGYKAADWVGSTQIPYIGDNGLQQLFQQLGQNSYDAPSTDNTGTYVAAGASIAVPLLIAM